MISEEMPSCSFSRKASRNFICWILSLGLIAIEQRFVDATEQDLAPERRRHRDVVEKYVPVRKHVPKRPPDGLNLPRLMSTICKRWNGGFLERHRTAKRIIEKIELRRACTHKTTK
jgi:hypothetical protein